MMTECLQDANLKSERITVHSLRHTAASLAIAAGGAPGGGAANDAARGAADHGPLHPGQAQAEPGGGERAGFLKCLP
jgi:hypothetical protein